MNKIQEAFIKANYEDLADEELTSLYNETFKTNKSIYSIRRYKKKLGLKKTYRRYKIGDEVVLKNGSVKIKVAHPRTWMYKHRYIYEQAFGKIPKNHLVIFLDGNKQNFSLDNLALIDEQTASILKFKGLMADTKELTETGILIAKIKRQQTILLGADEKVNGDKEEIARQRALAYYYNNIEEIKQKRKIYRKANAEKNRRYQREWYRRKKSKTL